MDDALREELLDGLEGEARAHRAELLDLLERQGFLPGHLRRAHGNGLLAFLPAERVVMEGDATLSARDVAAHAGVDLEAWTALHRAQGLPAPDPDEVRFSEAEAERVKVLAAFAALGMTPDQMATVLRPLGRGLSQAAAVMRSQSVDMAITPGATEREIAERMELIVEALMPHVGPMVEGLIRLHLRDMLRSEGARALERAHGALPGGHDVGVAFADLVGFTRMGEEVPAEEIGRVADRLAALAADVAAPPVRMVKTIGDAAMLVCDDPAELVVAALRLVAAVDAEGADFPQVRVGVARGEAVSSGGDWFGRPVNLASRITSLARAGSVLVAEAARADDDRLTWSFAHERRVRGVPDPVKLFRARPAG